MLRSLRPAGSSQGPVPIGWLPWHDMSKPRVGIPVKKDITAPQDTWSGQVIGALTLPQTHRATCSHHIQQQRHSSQQKARAQKRKPTFETVYYFLFQWGVDVLFSWKHLFLSVYSKQSRGVIYSEKPKMPGHRGALGCSVRQKEDVLPGWSPTPQAFCKVQIITPTHLCGPQLGPVSLGGHLEWDLAKSGLAVILDSLFSLQPTKFHQLSCPESSGIQPPFSILNPSLPLHTPHCSSLPAVSLHPPILLPFLTGPPQASS